MHLAQTARRSGTSGIGTAKAWPQGRPRVGRGATRIETLTRENERLRRQLAQAELIIDVQKKVASLLGMSIAQMPSGAF